MYNVIIIETKALCIGDLSRYWLSCLGPLVLLLPNNFTLCSYQLFRFWAYLMKIILGTRRVHYILYILFLWGLCFTMLSFLCSALLPLFVFLFFFAIVSSALLWFQASVFPFAIFRMSLWLQAVCYALRVKYSSQLHTDIFYGWCRITVISNYSRYIVV
jgi:hypothetical protein